MIDKFVQSAKAAVSGVRDGATILVGGFGSVGQPDILIEALAEQAHAISSWSPTMRDRANAALRGCWPRVGSGASSAAFHAAAVRPCSKTCFRPGGSNSKGTVLEQALCGDIALVEAWAADRWGNLMFRESARNFNPVMAMAAVETIAHVHHRRDIGTCVSRIYTDLSVIAVTDRGLIVLDIVDGLDPSSLRAKTNASLTFECEPVRTTGVHP